jgi:excisionase family DNA binding protein
LGQHSTPGVGSGGLLSVYESTKEEGGENQHMRKSSVDKPAHRHEQGSLVPLLDVTEAAALLGIKPWTLRQWTCQRRITFIKVGRLVKFRQVDIEGFIEQNRCEAVSFER